MTPRLSSYWLYFVSSTSYKLAVNLVNSMKIEIVCKDNELQDILGIKTIDFKRSVELAFEKIEQNLVLSSWKDSLITSSKYNRLSEFVEVPGYGCFSDKKEINISGTSEQVLDNIWWSEGTEAGIMRISSGKSEDIWIS